MNKTDHKRATIRDVAHLAGVSTMTVSRVLNDKGEITEETRQKVLDAISAVGYRPDYAARSLVRGRTDTIAFLAWDLANPHFVEIAKGIQEVTENEGYFTGIYTSHADQQRHTTTLRHFLEGRIDGMIVSLPLSEQVKAEATQLVQAGIPVVSIFGHAIAHPPVDNIRTDLTDGTRQAVGHLLQLGHRRIAFIGDPNDLNRPGRKLRAMRSALEQANLALPEEYTYESDWSFGGGYSATRDLLALSSRPTAIFAASDLVALGALRAATESGLRVPDDLSIVGFIDVPVASVVTPALTTVAEPHAEAGRAAARVLLDRLQKRRDDPGTDILLPCHLVVRETTAPPPQEQRTS